MRPRDPVCEISHPLVADQVEVTPGNWVSISVSPAHLIGRETSSQEYHQNSCYPVYNSEYMSLTHRKMLKSHFMYSDIVLGKQ